MAFNKRYNPSLDDLRGSLRMRSKELFLENSLHGVPYFADPTRPIHERIVWLICFSASLVASIVIILTILQKFDKNPTLIALDTDTGNLKVVFPRVFLCPIWPFDDYAEWSEDEASNYQKIYWWDENSGQPLLAAQNIKYNRFFVESFPDCSEIVRNCKFRGERDCTVDLRKITTPVGVCCALPAVQLRKEQEPYALTFDLQIYPTRFYLLANDSGLPRRQERATHIFREQPMAVSFAVFQTYSTEQVRGLSVERRKCIFEDEGSSLNVCETQCDYDTVKSMCGCAPWYQAKYGSDECPLDKYSSCLNLNATSQKSRKSRSCRCMLGCDHVSYMIESIKVLNVDSGKPSSIKMSAWPHLSFKRTVRFGFVDLLCTVGGVAAVCIGYSFLTTFELVNYLSLRTYCGAVLGRPRKRFNITTVNVLSLNRTKH